MSKEPREFWIRDNYKEFGETRPNIGMIAFESPDGVRGKDSRECELLHVIEYSAYETLTAKVTELEKDRERLEWMIGNGLRPIEFIQGHRVTGTESMEYFSTPREAIDAAMKESKKK